MFAAFDCAPLGRPLAGRLQPQEHYAANMVDHKAGNAATRYPAYYNGVVPRFCIVVVQGGRVGRARLQGSGSASSVGQWRRAAVVIIPPQNAHRA